MENQLREGRFRMLTKDGGQGLPGCAVIPASLTTAPSARFAPHFRVALLHSVASAYRAHAFLGASKAYNTAFLANVVNARNSLEVRSPKQEQGFSNGLNRLHSGSVFYYIKIKS